MSEAILVDPAGPRRRGWHRLAYGDPARPWALVGWMEQDVWLPVRPPVCRRWCNRPAIGEMALLRDPLAHDTEYFRSLYRKRPDASTLPTSTVIPVSGL